MKILSIVLLLLTCMAFQYLGAVDFIGNIFNDDTKPIKFESYWNQVTPENGGKWGNTEAVRDQYNWKWLDGAYNYAKAKGIPFKHHTFVWGQQEPSWIKSLSNKEKKEEVEEWIRDYAKRYTDTDIIDVVNEPLHAPPSYKEAIGGSGSSGWDWIVWTFEKARQYCPKAELHINDYGIISDPNAARNYVKIINILKKKNLIDGIGIQCHAFNMDGVNTHTMKQVLDLLGATGLPIYVSELDISGDDNSQLRIYKEKFPIFMNHKSVKGITFWGYVKGAVWKENTYLISASGEERPALSWLKKNYLLKTKATPAPPQTPIPTDKPTPTPPPQNAYEKIEAELFVEMKGLQTESCVEGGENLGYIHNGDYSAYLVDFTHGCKEIEIRCASNTSGGSVEVRVGSLNGKKIATLQVGGTGGWQSWRNFKANINEEINRLEQIYLIYKGGDGFLFNVNWLKFTKGSKPATTTLPYRDRGDVNNDGDVNIVDALLTAQYYVGNTPSKFDKTQADANCDKKINIVDALLIAQRYVKLIEKLYC